MNEHNPKSPSPSLLDEEGICMLSLDGGGVRGLSSLYVLKRIMDGHNAGRKRLGRSPQKPADIFDLIGGTSTGGRVAEEPLIGLLLTPRRLIAIMLGRLQMDVDECISAYNELIKVVFNEKARVHQSKFSLLGQTQARFDSGGLKAAIEKTLKDRGLSPTDSMVDSREPDCKVFVCATSKLDAAVCRFRSYSSHKSSVSATICQAARATSAATTFFNPVSIEGMKFVDGALGANNPVDQVEEEATEIWCPKTGNLQPLVKCFISVGTGRLPAYNIDDRVDRFIGTLAKMATDAEKIAEASTKRWRQHFEQGRYFRFNVEHGLQTVGMKEYRKKREIQATTDKYLDSQVQSFCVQRCIENLILKKRSTRPDFELLIAPQHNFASPSPSPQRTEKRNSQTKQSTYGETKPPPQPYFDVPSQLSKPSIDRPIYLRKLQAALSQDGHQRAVLTGLGGAGKTQIAIQFAEWLHETYPKASVFWISGDRIQQSYSDIAQKLDLCRRYQRELKFTDARVLFHRYISTENLGRWFLMFDDADANGDLLSPVAQPESVLKDLPWSKEGRILFITHSMKAASAAVQEQANQVVQVEGLEGSDASSILRHFLLSKRMLDDEAQVRELLSQLNGLPSGIKQAASPSQDAFSFILQKPDGGVQGSDSQESILKSITKSFQAVRNDNPHAGKLLEFISQIGPSSIPRTIFPGTKGKEGKGNLEQSIGTLCSFFLLVPRQGGTMFDMPTTVHLCTRVWVQQIKASKGLTEMVTKRLNELVPLVDWSKHLIWKKYQTHALRILASCHRFNGAPKHGIDRLEKLRKADSKASAMDKLVLLGELGKCYNYAEEYEKAAESLEMGIDAAENKIAKDDPILIVVKNNLAYAYEQKGEHMKCIAFLEETLPIQQEILGKSHFDTLKIQVYLIEQYSKIKDLTKAISLLEELVPIQRKSLGQVHKKTMSSENDLAELYIENRNVYTALKLYEHMVSVRQKKLEPGDEQRKWAELNMPVRSLYLAKSGGGTNQRSHFALFIPNAEHDRDTISEDFHSVKAIGTRIHVVGEPLMSGFAFEVHRNYNTQAYPDLKQLVFLGKIDGSILHNYPETEPEIRENTARSLLERVAESVTPPPKGQDIRAPIDGVREVMPKPFGD
ncbi:calcium-independent phospholipase A2-gamma [Fusarium pseudoanthophilum]|uniref:Calcium-independent phospholipase A2-gamma n=1 Tax=Fusarium pseudoanthophilum TaxID=48495 RepID=A0A8H5P3D8_9HYPO|nr:calcium-independent phospholipase A2-gamma [Fusarium pseudoanthophilum]